MGIRCYLRLLPGLGSPGERFRLRSELLLRGRHLGSVADRRPLGHWRRRGRRRSGFANPTALGLFKAGKRLQEGIVGVGVL